MTKLQLLSAAICCFCVAPHAKADSYAITFNPNSSSSSVPPPMGTFDYNGGTFSNFIVRYEGGAFDFTSLANKGFYTGDTNACTSTFQYLTQTGSCGPASYTAVLGESGYQIQEYIIFYTHSSYAATLNYLFPGGVLNPTTEFVSSGTFTTTDTTLAATPEPSSLALLCTGVLSLAGLLRKRCLNA